MQNCFHPATGVKSTPDMPIVVLSFSVGRLPLERTVRVDAIQQRDGSTKWRVGDAFSTYSINGQWADEPLPSSRSPAWLTEFRFPDLDSALKAATNAAAEKTAEYLELCRAMGVPPLLRN